MSPGDIVLGDVQQADGRRKIRPLLVLCAVPPFRDYLVCSLSTQLRSAAPELDLVLDSTDHSFVQSGLRQSSVIRVGMLAMLPSHSIAGTIGQVESSTLRAVFRNLEAFLAARRLEIPGQDWTLPVEPNIDDDRT